MFFDDTPAGGAPSEEPKTSPAADEGEEMTDEEEKAGEM